MFWYKLDFICPNHCSKNLYIIILMAVIISENNSPWKHMDSSRYHKISEKSEETMYIYIYIFNRKILSDKRWNFAKNMVHWDQFRDYIQNHWYGHWPLRKQSGCSTRAGSRRPTDISWARREGEKLSIFNTFPEWLVCIYMHYESSCWHLTTTLQGSSETNLKFICKRIAYSYL